MFDKLKELNELRELQKQIKAKELEAERDGVKVKMNGAFEVLEIILNPELSAEAQAKVLKALLNETREKLQKELAMSMAGKF